MSTNSRTDEDMTRPTDADDIPWSDEAAAELERLTAEFTAAGDSIGIGLCTLARDCASEVLAVRGPDGCPVLPYTFAQLALCRRHGNSILHAVGHLIQPIIGQLFAAGAVDDGTGSRIASRLVH